MLINIINNLPEFLNDAILDSVKLIPSLFIIFILVEIFETYFADKISSFTSCSKKIGPLLGSILAVIPQCGFSVIMTTLFLKKYITLGTLLAVYIATSDEAIPILFAYPNQLNTVVKIIIIKLIIAISVGYIVDLLVKSDLKIGTQKDEICEIGCCEHKITKHKLNNILIHPIKHTFNIFIFILIVCICLNYLFEHFGANFISRITFQNSILQPIIFGIFGLIPNCAVSVIITMTFIKGAIGFPAVISGLISNAGLGLLVLFTQKENLKKFLEIVGILLSVSILSGVLMQFLKCFIS